MMFKFGPICVALTILLTVYGQIVIKWQMQNLQLPDGFYGKLFAVLKQLLNPWVVSGFISAFAASLCWMAAMTKLKLSDAYPFTSLSLVLILMFSVLLFHEPLTTMKCWGTVLIVCGLILICR
jgi:multidrug transporter EmrE-like cation transporter